MLLTNERDQEGRRLSIADGGSGWHSDLSYMKRPSLGSLLHAVRVPETGGDTEWACLYRAYETLSEETKKRIEGLKAIHQFDQRLNHRLSPPDLRYRDEHSAKLRALTPNVEHSIVRTHPVTGRKTLFFSLRFSIGIADMEEAKGVELLDELLAHLEGPTLPIGTSGSREISCCGITVVPITEPVATWSSSPRYAGCTELLSWETSRTEERHLSDRPRLTTRCEGAHSRAPGRLTTHSVIRSGVSD